MMGNEAQAGARSQACPTAEKITCALALALALSTPPFAAGTEVDETDEVSSSGRRKAQTYSQQEPMAAAFFFGDWHVDPQVQSKYALIHFTFDASTASHASRVLQESRLLNAC